MTREDLFIRLGNRIFPIKVRIAQRADEDVAVELSAVIDMKGDSEMEGYICATIQRIHGADCKEWEDCWCGVEEMWEELIESLNLRPI